MDEPLSNLDAKLRVQTRTELADLQARLGVTTVYVTHDQVEAMTMGHRVAVLNFGKLQQVDKPRTLYARPANRFVAGFIGSPAMNIVDVTSDGSSLSFFGAEAPITDDVRRALTAAGAGTYAVGVRPEHLLAVAEGEGVMSGEVVVVEELGSEAFVHIRMEHSDNQLRELVVRAPGETSITRGDRASVAFDGPTHVFDADGERLGD